MSGSYCYKNKVVVITGAGGNFGREGCLYFAERGAKIVAMDLNVEALRETSLYIATTCTTPTEVLIAPCDVTDPESVQEAVDAAVEKFSRIDLLWNNAGYQGHIKPTLEYDPKDFALVMNVNVTGMFIVLQTVAKQMVKQQQQEQQKEGTTTTTGAGYSIVNTSSVAGLRGTPAMVAYASSKAAVLAMTVSTSKDLAPYGIRVNAVSPALIGPGFMWDRQNELHAACNSPYFANDPQTVAENKVGSVPMKRLGTIREVISSVSFLLSGESSYTTGTNLVVDGGMSSGLKC
jgi:NAD(P)-dependent dehydrogenase (short-subunit alcohol dehydrogenase family)